MHMEMNQRNLQLLQADAALAGTDDALRQRLSRLAQRRITPEKELPPMDFLFNLFDVPCFPRGELVGLTGRAKSGKTFVTSMLMAEAVAPQSSSEYGSIRIPQLHRRRQSPLRVLWLDTEQSEESTQDILRHRLLPMAGEGATAFLDVFNVRGECWQERLPLLEAAVTELLPDLVILDGIRDLVNDINDGVLAQEVIERLMRLAQEHQCCIVSVLHRNKSAEDRSLRGWIGTELTNKAFEVYGCEKADGRVFALEQLHTRKHDIFDTLRFTVGDGGLPVAIGWNAVTKSTVPMPRPAAPDIVSYPSASVNITNTTVSQPTAAEVDATDAIASTASVTAASDAYKNVKVFGASTTSDDATETPIAPQAGNGCTGADGQPVSASTCRATSTRSTINPHYIVRHADGSWDMNLPLLFSDALRGGIVRHADLVAWLKNAAGLDLMGYRARLINRAVTARIVLKSRDHVGHVIYALPQQMPTLFDSS